MPPVKEKRREERGGKVGTVHKCPIGRSTKVQNSDKPGLRGQMRRRKSEGRGSHDRTAEERSSLRIKSLKKPVKMKRKEGRGCNGVYRI